jgi:hypothetical protein
MCWLSVALRPYEASSFPRPLNECRNDGGGESAYLDGGRERADDRLPTMSTTHRIRLVSISVH